MPVASRFHPYGHGVIVWEEGAGAAITTGGHDATVVPATGYAVAIRQTLGSLGVKPRGGERHGTAGCDDLRTAGWAAGL